MGTITRNNTVIKLLHLNCRSRIVLSILPAPEGCAIVHIVSCGNCNSLILRFWLGNKIPWLAESNCINYCVLCGLCSFFVIRKCRRRCTINCCYLLILTPAAAWIVSEIIDTEDGWDVLGASHENGVRERLVVLKETFSLKCQTKKNAII